MAKKGHTYRGRPVAEAEPAHAPQPHPIPVAIVAAIEARRPVLLTVGMRDLERGGPEWTPDVVRTHALGAYQACVALLELIIEKDALIDTYEDYVDSARDDLQDAANSAEALHDALDELRNALPGRPK